MRIDLSPDADIASLVRTVRGESVVIVVLSGRDPLSLALALAAIGPLAVERAPALRVNVVMPGEQARPEEVDAAVAFLDSARSTTGQILALD